MPGGGDGDAARRDGSISGSAPRQPQAPQLLRSTPHSQLVAGRRCRCAVSIVSSLAGMPTAPILILAQGSSDMVRVLLASLRTLVSFAVSEPPSAALSLAKFCTGHRSDHLQLYEIQRTHLLVAGSVAIVDTKLVSQHRVPPRRERNAFLTSLRHCTAVWSC